MSSLDYSDITTNNPEKKLLQQINKKAVGNNIRRITTRHHGGRHIRKYRRSHVKRNKDGILGRVITVEYDPNRSANISLIHYADGEKRYILAPKGLKVDQKIESGENADIKPGNALPPANIPIGTTIHN